MLCLCTMFNLSGLNEFTPLLGKKKKIGAAHVYVIHKNWFYCNISSSKWNVTLRALIPFI